MKCCCDSFLPSGWKWNLLEKKQCTGPGSRFLLELCCSIHTRPSVKHSHCLYKRLISRGQKESLGGDGCVYGIDCGDDFTGVHFSPIFLSHMHQLCIAFGMSITP